MFPFAAACAAALAAAASPAENRPSALALEVPPALGIGTPKDHVLRFPGLEKDPAPILVPPDCRLLSRGKPVAGSEKEDPYEGELSMVTDGEKDGTEGFSVILGGGPQWVRIDLGASHLVDGVVLWHYFRNYRVVNDVIVQASDDAAFKSGVTTLFNNDTDNSSGQGAGSHAPFLGTFKGKQIPGNATKARYIRCWFNGSSDNKLNEIIEVEVWGRPLPR